MLSGSDINQTSSPSRAYVSVKDSIVSDRQKITSVIVRSSQRFDNEVVNCQSFTKSGNTSVYLIHVLV